MWESENNEYENESENDEFTESSFNEKLLKARSKLEFIEADLTEIDDALENERPSNLALIDLLRTLRQYRKETEAIEEEFGQNMDIREIADEIKKEISRLGDKIAKLLR